MLTARVAEGSMHLAITERSLRPGEPIRVRYGLRAGLTKQEGSYYIGPFDVVAYAHWLFVALTVGTLTVLIGYVVLDARKQVIERARARKGKDDETS
jgi:hypothetical protein